MVLTVDRVAFAYELHAGQALSFEGTWYKIYSVHVDDETVTVVTDQHEAGQYFEFNVDDTFEVA